MILKSKKVNKFTIRDNMFKRGISLALAATMIGSVISFSGCSNQNEDESTVTDLVRIVFDKDQELYNKIVSIRNDLKSFIGNKYWQQQVVIPMTDPEEEDLKNKILNTLELFNDFINSWDNEDSNECTKALQQIISAYFDSSESPKYVSFDWFYKFYASKAFPKGYDTSLKESKDGTFQTYNSGNNIIFYLGNSRYNSLVYEKSKITLNSVGNYDKIMYFYDNIIENLTNTYLYVLNVDGNALGLIKKDELGQLKEDLKKSIVNYSGFDSNEYGAYMNDYGEWDIYDSNDIYITHVPELCCKDLNKMNQIENTFEIKIGDPFEIKKSVDRVYDAIDVYGKDQNVKVR